ncbi:unnamed protein product [Enterobius vermicularis]|uniref:CULLIN_2 domain-containing protein n=1 Tax=Enterobius vermicularis TaxID=51028 RepID=A0A0N4V631_ENTVE|nr:unnamed protein product [Enterobius vermicularis]
MNYRWRIPHNNTADADSSDVELLEHCFGKIKSSLGLYPKLRARLDRNVRAARMDKIVGLLKEKILKLCTTDETHTALNYLKKFSSSVEMVNAVVRNLTTLERSSLNIWDNLGDSNTESAFYLQKFKELSDEQYHMLKTAFADLMNTFMKSNTKQSIAKFLVTLKPDEISELKKLAKAGKMEKIQLLTKEKLEDEDLTEEERSEITDFTEKLFSVNDH